MADKKKSKMPYAVRLKVPTESSTTFKDLIRGEVTVDHAELDDYILVRTGGEPTYTSSPRWTTPPCG